MRERGDVIKWEDSGHTFIVIRPENAGEVMFKFSIERWNDDECYPQRYIDPLPLWNVLGSQDFEVVSKTEARV